MQPYDIEQMVYGIIHSSSPRKQLIGRSLAKHMSFIPGPGGKDGSVDGAILSECNNLVGHFQSKLSSRLIPLDEGKILHSDILRLQPQVSIYVSGVGFDESVIRLLENQLSEQRTTIHLLSLRDIFSQSERYMSALRDIPPHEGGEINWGRFFV
ncbi:hypothetical protein TUM17387_28530 [Shewanella carassii]|uniref:hypothetical protein n=1 Tax=Shewanella carassii TaxID=1987584 RepID=UPI001BED43DD|nr:hypothetical protein [Shewanella carassii]BCV67494.1 hypothetical protein TUM17387_28530 [Shewanella carassii]